MYSYKIKILPENFSSIYERDLMSVNCDHNEEIEMEKWG